jgi:dienelactone hydrolase
VRESDANWMELFEQPTPMEEIHRNHGLGTAIRGSDTCVGQAIATISFTSMSSQRCSQLAGVCAVAIIATCLIGCTTTSSTYVQIPPLDVAGSNMPTRALRAVLTLPEGKPPYPVVILLHGCGGVSAELQVWARRLAAWGYASVSPDSYTPRGYSRVCSGPAESRAVTPQDRAGDVVSTALWLRTRSGIDSNHIAVVGFSNGGWTAMWVTQRRYQLEYPNLIQVAVSYYGNCDRAAEHGTVPLLVLMGEADNWDDPARRCDEFGVQLTPNQNFQIHTYPGVVHAFDDESLSALHYSEGHPLQYNATAAQDSFGRTKAFLDRYVGHSSGP